MPALYVLDGEDGIDRTIGGRDGLTYKSFTPGTKDGAGDRMKSITRVHISVAGTGEIFKLYKDFQAKRPRHFELHRGNVDAEERRKHRGDRIAYGGVGPKIVRSAEDRSVLHRKTARRADDSSEAGEIRRN